MAQSHHPDHSDHIGHAPAHHQAPLGAYFVVFITLAVVLLTEAHGPRLDDDTKNTQIHKDKSLWPW